MVIMDLSFPAGPPFSVDTTLYSVTVSFSGFFQSSMIKDGHPSTVTTVRFVAGFWGALEAMSVSSPISVGKCCRVSVMEHGTSSSFCMYFTWSPVYLGVPEISVSVVGRELNIGLL